MKFNEKHIMDLIQNEKSRWDATDLSWFDDDLLEKFENNELEKLEHKKIVLMLANDQAMMNHYKELKKQNNRGSMFSWLSDNGKNTWIFAGLLVLAFSTVLLNQSVTTIEEEDMKRGTKITTIFPANNAIYESFPKYFLIPEPQELIRVEMTQANEILWHSQWQQVQKIYIPIDIRDSFSTGTYKWKVITTNNKEVYSGHFTVDK